MERRKVSFTVIALLACATAAGAQRYEPWCKPGSKPDLMRVRLGAECGEPKRIQLRRNGDDGARVDGLIQDGGWWLVTTPAQTVDDIKLCSRVCGYASICVVAEPKPEHDESGKRQCVAEYNFDCGESAWSLAVEANPSSTLVYTRKRLERLDQRGQITANPAGVKPVEICDLGVSETVEIVPRTRTVYSFDPIPVSYDALSLKKKKEWPLGQEALMKYVRLPGGTRRAQDLSVTERAYVQLDIRELKLMIATVKAAGEQR